MINLKYKEQVALLLEVIEPTFNDTRLALKGGTAINLFTMNMPRFSVDIDLIYLPVTARDEFILGIEDVFLKMEKRLVAYSPEILRTKEGIPKQARISKGGTNIKIEVNLVLRGSVYPPQILELCQKAQETFQMSTKIMCASFEDQYAGKFCAALDRQHPRDLFDVKLFFEQHTIAERLKKAFLVYLISGNRPMSEMIQPNLLDQRILFFEQFEGMVENGPSYEELDCARTQLIQAINQSFNDDDRAFLLSFKRGSPQWELLGIPGIESLPGVRWKLMNIKKVIPEKHKEALMNLEKKLA